MIYFSIATNTIIFNLSFSQQYFQVSDKIHYIVHMQTNSPTIQATLKEGCRDNIIALTVTIERKNHFLPAVFILNGCLFFLSLEVAAVLLAPEQAAREFSHMLKI